MDFTKISLTAVKHITYPPLVYQNSWLSRQAFSSPIIRSLSEQDHIDFHFVFGFVHNVIDGVICRTRIFLNSRILILAS